MQNELVKMKTELAGILGRNAALKQAVREVNKMDMIKASLIARNPKHQSIQVDSILDGQLQKDIPVGDYMFIQNYCELVRNAYNYMDMGYSVDSKLLTYAYRVLAEDPDAHMRRENTVVLAFSHVPPDFEELNDRLARSFARVYSREMDEDITAGAMYMHNCIIDNWPFDEFNGEIAIFAMNYYLMEKGLMAIDMPMDRKDYLDMVSSSLKGIRPDEEYAFFEKAITEKMKSAIHVCRGYVE